MTAYIPHEAVSLTLGPTSSLRASFELPRLSAPMLRPLLAAASSRGNVPGERVRRA